MVGSNTTKSYVTDSQAFTDFGKLYKVDRTRRLVGTNNKDLQVVR